MEYNYKVTFEDGSEAYLEHYGVKGMKWKDHVAKEEDQSEKKHEKKQETFKNVHKALTQKFTKKTVTKAKAKVKAKFAKPTRVKKNLYIKRSHVEVLDNGKTKTTYY